MTRKIVTAIYRVFLLSLVFIAVLACEKDFENIGVGLVDNNLFSAEKASFKVIANTTNVDSSRVDGILQYPVGIYKDDNFGYIKASFVSQLGLTTTDFGDNVSIDTIILDIPYYATRLEDYDDGRPNFKLDSIMGDVDEYFTLSVYELGTFLNSLDPLDPTKDKKYYSNEQYTTKSLLYTGLFRPESNDTVLYVKRRFLDDDRLSIDDTDTIKKTDLAPSIKIPLDTTFFRNKFINEQESPVFDSYDAFINYFRGLYITPEGETGSLMTLAMSDATLTIYYTNVVLTDETDTDLNGDGDTNDEDVPVRTKQSTVFSLSGERASQFERDYNSSLAKIDFDNPDNENGQDKLYIQGASGTNAVLDLFSDIDQDSLQKIRDENWLINEASLTLYLDETSSSNVPEQLFLYNLDDNSQLLDALTEYSFSGVGGVLERDREDNKPVKYKFYITDYISEFLKNDNTESLHKLAVKVYHSLDLPDVTVVNDTIVKDYSWITKGVVLKGNNRNDEQKLKLEIYYTKNNN